MTAEQDQVARDSLDAAIEARERCNESKAAFADAYLRALRDGQGAGWSWRRIGEALGVSEQACRRYWEMHRQRAGRLR